MEQQEARKPIDWLKFMVVTESLLILLVLLMLGAKSCRDMLYTPEFIAYGHICIHTYPDKLVYVIGQDTELDLTGGQVCFSDFARDLHGYPCKALTGNEQPAEDQAVCRRICSMAEYAPSRADFARRMPNLDFTKPGIYNVVLWDGWDLECSFPIQVVDREYLE